jgi:hypothetical protein
LRESEKFSSVEAVVGWHNEIKPHRSLEWDELCNAFWCKLPPIEGKIIGMPSCVLIVDSPKSYIIRKN